MDHEKTYAPFDDRTDAVRSAVITSVNVWTAYTNNIAHWRTSYLFDPSTSMGYKGELPDVRYVDSIDSLCRARIGHVPTLPAH